MYERCLSLVDYNYNIFCYNSCPQLITSATVNQLTVTIYRSYYCCFCTIFAPTRLFITCAFFLLEIQTLFLAFEKARS